MSMPSVEIKNASLSFGSKSVLNDISLRFDSGKFYGLTGVNGAGKSSLMNILAGNIFPDQGEISFFGEKAGVDPAKMHAKTLYVSEHMLFDLNQSVEQISKDFSKFYPRWNSAIWNEWKEHFKLDTQRMPQTFSRGQNMQISLGIQMATQPELLLIDEITAVLDSYARDFVLKKLKSECENGKTVVMATNLLTDLNTGVSDMILLHDSKVSCQLKTNCLHEKFKKMRLKSEQELTLLQGTFGILVSQNSDRSSSYLMATEDFEKAPQKNELLKHNDQQWLASRNQINDRL